MNETIVPFLKLKDQLSICKNDFPMSKETATILFPYLGEFVNQDHLKTNNPM